MEPPGSARPIRPARARAPGGRALARLAALLAVVAACDGEPLTGRSASPPVGLAISPAEGPIRGGTRVTITGRGFHEGTTILMGGARATDVRVVGDGVLTATAPAGRSPCSVTVMVMNPDGRFSTLASSYRYLPDGPNSEGVCPGPWDY